MQRPTQHQIDEAAQRVFIGTIPVGWVHRDQKPDYGIDFQVEIFEQDENTGGNEQTGDLFAVQLKGTESPRMVGRNVHFPIETKHLAYYLDREKRAVFLVVVDVRKRVGWWIFLQRDALNQLPVGWRDQQTVMIRLSIENRWKWSSRLQKAIADAIVFMRDRGSNSAIAAVLAEQEDLELLDPRFSVELTATATSRHLKIRPKDPGTALGIRMSPAVAKRLESKLALAQPMNFRSGEIELESPLLSKLFAKGGIIVNPEHEVFFRFVPVFQGIRSDPIAIPGRLCMGTKAVRFEGALGPLTLSVSGKTRGRKMRLALSVTFTAAKWNGQFLRGLAHFDDIYNVLRPVGPEERLDLECYLDGNRIFGGEGGIVPMENVPQFLLAMKKARHLAAHFAINPKFDAGLAKRGQLEIEHLYDLVTTGELRVSGEDLTLASGSLEHLTAGESRPPLPDFLPEVEVEPGDPSVFRIFDQTVSVQSSKVRLTNVRVERQESSPESIVLVGCEASEQFVRIEKPLLPPLGQ